MSTSPSVLIIGGGIIGLSVAESLTRESTASVMVVDSTADGNTNGCSFGNGGIIVPSHFVPLADPGLLRAGLKMMLSPSAPFGLQGIPDFATIGWVSKFLKSANHRQVAAAAPLLRDLNLASRAAYESLIQRLGLHVGYAQRGLLMLCQTQASLTGELELAAKANDLGLKARAVTRDEFPVLEPNLKIEALGGVLFEDDAHLTPSDLMAGLRSALEARGVQFVSGRVTGFDGQSLSLQDGQKLEAEQFVFAAGAWAGELLKRRVSLPMLSGKGYGITADSAAGVCSAPLILTEARVAVTPMTDGTRFVGTLELGHPSNSVNARRVSGFLESIGAFLPAYKQLDRSKVWVGNRPCTPDGLPYVGRLQSDSNVVVAAGHAMMGMSLGPVTGDMVADIVLGRKPAFDLSLLDPHRFSK